MMLVASMMEALRDDVSALGARMDRGFQHDRERLDSWASRVTSLEAASRSTGNLMKMISALLILVLVSSGGIDPSMLSKVASLLTGV